MTLQGTPNISVKTTGYTGASIMTYDNYIGASIHDCLTALSGPPYVTVLV